MKEASPNPILAVFVGKASQGTAFCIAFSLWHQSVPVCVCEKLYEQVFIIRGSW